VFASSAEDAARVGFDDAFIYQELDKKIAKRKLKTTQLKIDGHLLPFVEWKKSEKKIKY
jgi:guanine deaminase